MPLRGQSANTPLILPEGVAFDAAGNLYFVETGRHVVRRLTPSGVLSIVAGTGTQGFSGDGGLATNALLDSPSAVALDAAANLFIADTHNHRIRRVDAATGSISTYVSASLPVALAFDPTGNLVYADAATHRVTRVSASTGQATVLAGNGTQGFAGDGGLATAASLDTPSGLAFDAGGNLYLADAHNHRVRRVDAATGIVTTVAGTGTSGFTGDGFAATGAQLSLPRGVSLDAAGNLYVADTRNQRIRRIDAATGTVTTIAGNGTQGFAGDGAAATGAALNSPRSVAISPGGLATVADTGNNRVRQVDAVGNLHTVAGSGAILPAGAVSSTALVQTNQQTLTATVTGAGGTATGDVSLIDGTTSIASEQLTGGTASFSTGVLSTGSHTLTAAYGGSSTYQASTSAPLIVTVGGNVVADFSLTAAGASAGSLSGTGGSASFGFTVAPTGPQLANPIGLAVSGLPSGATATFNPTSIAPSAGPSSFSMTVVLPASVELHPPFWRRGAELACLALLLPLALRRRRRELALAALLLLTGCGARTINEGATSRTPVTYNLVVTASSTTATGAALAHTATVTLTVN